MTRQFPITAAVAALMASTAAVAQAEQVFDRVASFPVASGKTYAVTDNDGVDDSSGETLFFPVVFKGTN